MRIYTNSKAIALRSKQCAVGTGIGKLGFEIWIDIASIGNIGLTFKRLLLVRYSKQEGNRQGTGVSIPLW